MNGWGQLLVARSKGEITNAAFADATQRLGGLPFGEDALQVLEGALRSSADSVSEQTGPAASYDDVHVAERVAKDLGWH